MAPSHLLVQKLHLRKAGVCLLFAHMTTTRLTQGVAEELLTGSGEGSVNLAGLTGLWDMALGTVADQLTAAAPGSGSGSPHTSVLSAVVDHAHRVGNARALCAAMESSVRSDTAAAAATVACKPVLETQSAAVAELSRCVSRPERQVDLPPAAS